MKQNSKIFLLAKQVWREKTKSSSTIGLLVLFNILLFCALSIGYFIKNQQQETVEKYSLQVRQRWENRPDKHPHRMAHYGYVAFREPAPLSFFDLGMESYLGNAVFLEAHKQNTVNFSDSSFSNGLMRFGEISAGMLLLLLLPLFIVFLGFDLVTKEREQLTLKLLLIQGVSWWEIIVGKSLGLFYLVLTLFIPSVIFGFILLVINDVGNEVFVRYLLLVISYFLYFMIVVLGTVFVSALAKSSKSALMVLIGFWLFFTLIIPKTAQVAGQNMVPSPSKIEFDTKTEQELLALGDSHNPNDPHFKQIKDSLLQLYKVDSVQQLPFNYGGFVMRESEKLSAKTYTKHQEELVELYKNQQNVVRYTAIFNPYMAIKNISLALSGTDFAAYTHFQNQTEDFRYNLAQKMNELQIKHIANKVKNSADKNAIISKQHWKELPDFKHKQFELSQVFKNEMFSFLALAFSFFGLGALINYSIKNLKAF